MQIGAVLEQGIDRGICEVAAGLKSNVLEGWACLSQGSDSCVRQRRPITAIGITASEACQASAEDFWGVREGEKMRATQNMISMRIRDVRM